MMRIKETRKEALDPYPFGTQDTCDSNRSLISICFFNKRIASRYEDANIDFAHECIPEVVFQGFVR